MKYTKYKKQKLCFLNPSGVSYEEVQQLCKAQPMHTILNKENELEETHISGDFSGSKDSVQTAFSGLGAHTQMTHTVGMGRHSQETSR